MDPRDIELIHKTVWAQLNPRAMTGTISMALSCLDIALWDIQGKQQGRSIAALLGNARKEVPAYITFGFPQYDRDQLVEAANSMSATASGAEIRRRRGQRRLARGCQADAAHPRRRSGRISI